MRPIDQGFQETFTWEEYAKATETRVNPIMRINGGKASEYPGYLDDILFDKAVDYIKDRSTDNKSFFAYVASFFLTIVIRLLSL